MPVPLHVHATAASLVDAVLTQALATPMPYAIAGLQGSGKSTLAARCVEAAEARRLHAITVSIDDFYLDRPARLALARRVHPLLATRGPPGTHDVALAVETLDALADDRPV
ncbi:MAG TPA: kinase, partial [Lysobacter sp.]